ncbi:hypothetical protein [Nocardia otitidiscaviarum]|uniref:hypothetical protein n=1 Tax=Nocardia otitidiscaviarum TaxID=1823 RepID=UPI001893175F|nr:hypothetical protein [Nocardia otitidiscaviarum]MBF6177956.1 hypothetical protein [Nocardia otitidiscaviarum]
MEDIPLATLSAVTHATDPRIDAILKSLATALRQLDEEDARWVFAEYTELGLGSTPAAEYWRKLMTVDLSFFRSETAQRLRDQARAAGLAEGILRILNRRGIDVPDESRERISMCTDLELLGVWLDRALCADNIADVFADRL